MLSIHKTIGGKMTRLESIQDGCWVNLTYPSEDELNTVAATLAVEPTFLRAALDEEETSRIDTEDGQTLIIIDVPAVEKDDAVVYSTLPLGIIVTEKHIITVCLKESSIIKDFQEGLVKYAETQKRTRFILYMLLSRRFKAYKLVTVSGILIVAGGVGNLIDRIFRGYVVDFISVTWIGFPIFNIADCCVVIGAVLLLIFFFFIYDDKPAAKLPAGPDGKDVSAASKEAADGGQITDDSSGDGGKTD